MTARASTGIAILLFTGLLAGTVGLLYSKGSADLPGWERQPVPFAHELHAGRLQIDCLYCHRAATVSTAAGIPSLQLCMGCHNNVAGNSPSAPILLEHWKQREPLRWVRLQRLPDFVYFTHERHLAHGLDCLNCHGNVREMRDTPRAATYEMGWCLSCHQQRGAPRDCWTCHK
jgi:predicted CXXCH cytochrome family protein